MNKFIVNVIIKFIVVLICGTIAFLCVYHDYSLYSKPIGKITTVKTSGEKQQIQAEIKNGEEKGQFRDIELKYDKALVYDQKYHKGDVVFLDSELKTITGVKRAHWVAAAVILLLGYPADDGSILPALCFYPVVSGQRGKQSYIDLFFCDHRSACSRRAAMFCPDLEDSQYGV